MGGQGPGCPNLCPQAPPAAPATTAVPAADASTLVLSKEVYDSEMQWGRCVCPAGRAAGSLSISAGCCRSAPSAAAARLTACPCLPRCRLVIPGKFLGHFKRMQQEFDFK